jgi:hypothetical protein
VLQLSEPDSALVEHVVADGPLAGVTLVMRPPSYADRMAGYLARTDEAWQNAVLRIITGWKGANGDPSPFVDHQGTPVAFSPKAFEECARQYPELIKVSDAAASTVFFRSRDTVGKSAEPDGSSAPASPSTTPTDHSPAS